MTVSVYIRHENGQIEYKGPQAEFCNEQAYLEYFDLIDVEPETEKLAGWPHSYVRWFGAFGIGG